MKSGNTFYSVSVMYFDTYGVIVTGRCHRLSIFFVVGLCKIWTQELTRTEKQNRKQQTLS